MATDISTLIANLQTARNKIRTKLQEMGLATSTSKLSECATAVESIENKGAVQATVQEGDTYTIPKGYHNGSGTVSGVAGGGNYNLQSKVATPTKNQQNITPESGFYGLSDVTINPIPEQYQDVSDVTTKAENVLAGDVFVATDGTPVAGTMVNNGDVERTLDTSTTEFTIPKGYHSGYGKVSIVTEEKTVTPTEEEQIISPVDGKVISVVTVGAIPDEYIVTDDADAEAPHILKDKTGYVKGVKVTGTMPDNGAINASIDGLTVTSFAVPAGYHNGSGVVNLTDSIATALASI